jgi:hypothetical protein
MRAASRCQRGVSAGSAGTGLIQRQISRITISSITT